MAPICPLDQRFCLNIGYLPGWAFGLKQLGHGVHRGPLDGPSTR
jgi:hypothetical protein